MRAMRIAADGERMTGITGQGGVKIERKTGRCRGVAVPAVIHLATTTIPGIPTKEEETWDGSCLKMPRPRRANKKWNKNDKIDTTLASLPCRTIKIPGKKIDSSAVEPLALP
jgi:hypothetical protein